MHSVVIFSIFLLKLAYLRKYSRTVRANFVVFQNPGWDFPKAWVEFSKTLGGPNPGWDFPKAWVEFSKTLGGPNPGWDFPKAWVEFSPSQDSAG